MSSFIYCKLPYRFIKKGAPYCVRMRGGVCVRMRGEVCVRIRGGVCVRMRVESVLK